MLRIDLIEPQIAELVLDRPDRRNAIPIAGWKALAALPRTLPAEARVLILHGERDFSAGADLEEMRALEDQAARRAPFREAIRAGLDAVAALPIPVIAVVSGGCYGMGVGLALAADIRIAGADARFAITPARLGIGYPAPDVARLRALVGAGRAARLLFAAEPLDAEGALAARLIDEVAADPMAAALSLARPIAANSGESVRMLKRVLANPADPVHDRAFDAMFAKADFAEGLAAYHARRAPRFG